MARQPGARTQVAFAFESVYGTPPASGYRRMPFATTTLGSEQGLLSPELLGYGRDPQAPIRDAVNVDGDVIIPMDAENLGFWLKAIFGQPVTTGTTPRTHTFQSGGFTLPSMAIETQMPDVPRFAMYSGLVADRIQWQSQRSGLLTATVGLIGRGETVAATTAAGVLTDATLPLQRFGNFQGSITRNGAALGNIVSAQVSYANNLDRIETIRNDGLLEGLDPSMAALTGSIEARFADLTLVNQAIAGDPCELVFAWSLGANASLTFTVHAAYLPRPRIPINGPQGVQATFEWQAAAVVDSVCDQRSAVTACWRGNAAGLGGFTLVARISLTTLQPTGMGFFGLLSSVAALAVTTTLSALVEAIGLGFQRGTHTNWQLISNDATGAPTLVDLGAGFPVVTGGLITLTIWCPAAGTSIWLRTVNELTGAVFEQEVTSDLPQAATFLAPRLFLNNGATAAAVAFECTGLYLETDF